MSVAVLGFTAGIMHITAFYLYYKQTLRKVSNPNAATWILWFAISLFNCVTYGDMSENVALIFLPAMSTAGCMTAAIIFFYKGSLSKLDFLDSTALGLGLIAAFVWFRCQSAEYGNLILQPSIIISFIPTYRGVIKENTEKNPLPWFIWTAAYILQIGLVILLWDGNFLKFAYPVNCFFLHIGVGALSLIKNSERRF